jgi:hypothetical protein
MPKAAWSGVTGGTFLRNLEAKKHNWTLGV